MIQPPITAPQPGWGPLSGADWLTSTAVAAPVADVGASGSTASLAASSFRRELLRLLRIHIRPGSDVLQIGCHMPNLLAQVGAARGTGIDSRPEVIAAARRALPGFSFQLADPQAFELDKTFDTVVITDAVAELNDIQACLERIRRVCKPTTRVILAYYNPAWEPILKLADKVGLRRSTGLMNWLSNADVQNLLTLSGFELIRRTDEMLLPLRVPGLAALCNRVLARLRPTRALSLVRLVIARPIIAGPVERSLTCSVVIPTRNERGNVEAAVRRTPRMGAHTELIFVDGDSTDGTSEEIERVIAAHPDRDIRLIRQGDGRGKGDAVRKGFAAARGDVLMILDADLTVPPEELPKFFDCIASGKAEFVNGTRLVYPMQRDAMRSLNKLANAFFSRLFTWLLEQRFRDTLCGTKVLRRNDYERIAADRAYFGDFDPFGDFDLIFGAARANLKILEIPIRYHARTYGVSNIRRFLHGLLLLRMSLVALRKLKLR